MAPPPMAEVFSELREICRNIMVTIAALRDEMREEESDSDSSNSVTTPSLNDDPNADEVFDVVDEPKDVEPLSIPKQEPLRFPPPEPSPSQIELTVPERTSSRRDPHGAADSAFHHGCSALHSCGNGSTNRPPAPPRKPPDRFFIPQPPPPPKPPDRSFSFGTEPPFASITLEDPNQQHSETLTEGTTGKRTTDRNNSPVPTPPSHSRTPPSHPPLVSAAASYPSIQITIGVPNLEVTPARHVPRSVPFDSSVYRPVPFETRTICVIPRASSFPKVLNPPFDLQHLSLSRSKPLVHISIPVRSSNITVIVHVPTRGSFTAPKVLVIPLVAHRTASLLSPTSGDAKPHINSTAVLIPDTQTKYHHQWLPTRLSGASKNSTIGVLLVDSPDATAFPAVQTETKAMVQCTIESVGRYDSDFILLIKVLLWFYEQAANSIVIEHCLVVAVMDGINIIPFVICDRDHSKIGFLVSDGPPPLPPIPVSHKYAYSLVMFAHLSQACDYPLLLNDFDFEPCGKDSVAITNQILRVILIHLSYCLETNFTISCACYNPIGEVWKMLCIWIKLAGVSHSMPNDEVAKEYNFGNFDNSKLHMGFGITALLSPKQIMIIDEFKAHRENLCNWRMLMVWGILIVWQMMACTWENVCPSIMKLGKALAEGIMPVSKVLEDTEVLFCEKLGKHGKNSKCLGGYWKEPEQDGYTPNGSLLEFMRDIAYLHKEVKTNIFSRDLEGKVSAFRLEKFHDISSHGALFLQHTLIFSVRLGIGHQWDPSGYLRMVTAARSVHFKQWDPGKFIQGSNFYNLEDKVDFDGVGIVICKPKVVADASQCKPKAAAGPKGLSTSPRNGMTSYFTNRVSHQVLEGNRIVRESSLLDWENNSVSRIVSHAWIYK